MWIISGLMNKTIFLILIEFPMCVKLANFLLSCEFLYVIIKASVAELRQLRLRL